MNPRHNSFLALSPHGFTRIGYAEWGRADATRVVVCVHGLTRNARDFDPLARALAAEGARVVAPDMPGRGRSAWLAHPEDYSYAFYVPAMAAMLARLDAESVEWIGTSMGGLIGMMLAAQPETPIKRLVLNDIGPFIPKESLRRIATYVGADPRFADLDAVERYLREVHAPFGALSDAEWRHLAEHSSAKADDGTLRLHYDPSITKAFTTGEIDDIVLWPVWDKVAVPSLVIRGASSDLLLAETATEMTQRGDAAARGAVERVEIAGCGHAPALMAVDQVSLVQRWLGRAL